MEIYIALLRGINVSGKKKIKMTELKFFLEELNFKNVKTYIQSGNVIFKHEKQNLKYLKDKIENKIFEIYEFQVETIILTPLVIESVITNNPFLSDQNKELNRIYVTFLADSPSPINIEKLKSINHSDEEYIIDGKIIYFFSPKGYGKVKMNNNFFENKLKVSATTRNWKTVNKLAEIAEKI